jgi:DNA-binding CsgD family transcriptional regulator
MVETCHFRRELLPKIVHLSDAPDLASAVPCDRNWKLGRRGRLRGAGSGTMITTETRTRQSERTFSEIKRLSTSNLAGPELLRRTAERLSKAVPFEAYCASMVDPASRLITYGIAEGMGGEEDGESGNVYLDRIYFEEDLPVMNEMLRERRTVQLLSETTGGALERSLRYRELLRPHGFGYELGGAFVDGSLWGGMDLIREQGDPDFSGAEVALIRRLAPHVGAGLKAAALRSRATTEQDSPDVPGVLTLDRSGKIVSHTPSAEHWLRDLEDLDPSWRDESIPMSVRMVSGALRHALSPGSDNDHNLIPRVRVRGRSGRWLALYGSLTEPTGDRPGETVIVIGPAKPEEVAWLNVAAYGLSPREEEVVGLLVRGFTNRQISRTLFISEHTVQRHLSNTFEKVGVRSRKTLLKRLFFENLLPVMAGT